MALPFLVWLGSNCTMCFISSWLTNRPTGCVLQWFTSNKTASSIAECLTSFFFIIFTYEIYLGILGLRSAKNADHLVPFLMDAKRITQHAAIAGQEFARMPPLIVAIPFALAP